MINKPSKMWTLHQPYSVTLLLKKRRPLTFINGLAWKGSNKGMVEQKEKGLKKR